MCGIIMSIAEKGSCSAIYEELTPWISARGPDSLKTITLTLPTKDNRQVVLIFTSSVLHLRGQEVTVQPLVSPSGNILCWNGEIWKGLTITETENDGVKLLDALSSSRGQVWRVMERVEGPWAMVYYDSGEGKVYFGRDCLGRRSLLRGRRGSSAVVLSSIGVVGKYDWEEVSVDGLWSIDLNDTINHVGISPSTKLYPWVVDPAKTETDEYMVCPSAGYSNR
jgi:asparagine synthetase B (glutamine-hydrolysing)